jgi:mannose-6-phosphate isomerase-like protein (cupin superfamily)
VLDLLASWRDACKDAVVRATRFIIEQLQKPTTKVFALTYVRAKTAKGAALHWHATEEVFIPVKGRWQVFWLDGEEERTVDLDEGDVINVPIGIYRGFRSLTDAPDALLMAIIGGPDAGKVDWHPSVLEEARKTGLSVDDEGNLIIEKPAA